MFHKISLNSRKIITYFILHFHKYYTRFCYVDDTLVVTAENDIPTLERKVNTAQEAMIHWIELAGLNLATMKMEAVLFTRHRQFSPPPSA